jgi:hypothetical protein
MEDKTNYSVQEMAQCAEAYRNVWDCFKRYEVAVGEDRTFRRERLDQILENFERSVPKTFRDQAQIRDTLIEIRYQARLSRS